MNTRLSRLVLAGGRNAAAVWMVATMNPIGPDPRTRRNAGLASRKDDENFSEYWRRPQAEPANRLARDEEVLERA